MGATRTWWVRLLVACAFGLAVAGITIYWVPGNTGDFTMVYPQLKTQRSIEQVAQSLGEFQVQHGHLPATLDEVQVWGYDGWGRAFLYSCPQGKALVESLGSDGARGGFGLDADLSNQNLHPPQARVPLLQKLKHPLAQGMIWVALLCGAMAGAIVYRALGGETAGTESLLGWGLTLLIAFAMAAVFITSIHVPSGH